jgi:hypothetical protein
MNPNDDNAKLPEEQRPPLIWQCRYGGIEVPNDLWKHCTSIKEDRFMASLVIGLPVLKVWYPKKEKSLQINTGLLATSLQGIYGLMFKMVYDILE